MKQLVAVLVFVSLSGCASLAQTRALEREPPEGATALCHDGVFSFTQSRWDACSQHEGIATWLASR